MLQKRYRLPAKTFSYLYDNGRKYRSECGMLVVTPYSGMTTPRFGYVITKKIGNAPQRHRMTRILRVITHELIKRYNLNDNGYIYEFIAFKFCDDYSTLKNMFNSLLEKSTNDKKGSS